MAAKTQGAKRRMALHLRTLDIGTVFTLADLRAVLGGDGTENFGRRLRELRKIGWSFWTYREDKTLRPAQRRLVVKGDVPGNEQEND